jgi:hypothetical protein
VSALEVSFDLLEAVQSANDLVPSPAAARSTRAPLEFVFRRGERAFIGTELFR